MTTPSVPAGSDLSAEDRRRLREEVFTERPEKPCKDCGGLHYGICPRIRRLRLVGEGQSVGNRVEVEYWHSWDDSRVIYPEDAWEEDEV